MINKQYNVILGHMSTLFHQLAATQTRREQEKSNKQNRQKTDSTTTVKRQPD